MTRFRVYKVCDHGTGDVGHKHDFSMNERPGKK